MLLEFDSNHGIADIIRVELRRDWKRYAKLGRVPARWAFALRELPYRRVFSVSHFQQMCGSSRDTAMAMLRLFANLGYCRRLHAGWIKERQPRPLLTDFVTYEAKLSDWKRALRQAYRHLDFAHRSWVLLDSAHSSAALKNLEEFKRLNVGLVTIAVNGPLRIRFSPVRRKPRSALRYWYANAAVGRFLKA